MREAELMAHDHWTREQLLALQRERLHSLITYAVSNSPYYREALGADAADRPLAELPSLPKSTLMAEFDKIVTDPRLRLADLRAHIGGPDPSQSFLGAFRVATTSGTTGQRAIIEYAFIYNENGLRAQIVLAAGAAVDVPERLRQALIAAIGSTGAVPPTVEVEPVPALKREPGGKLRLVRSA